MTSKSKPVKLEWWKTVFDDKYLNTIVDSPWFQQTEQQVSFVVRNLRLQERAEILDLACGHGRHSLALAKFGYRVTGLDLSKHFITLAEKEAEKQGVKVRFLRGDMRHMSFVKEFDAIISIFTSFGFFEDESDHGLVLANVSRALKPTGRFLLDVFNPLRNLVRMAEAGTKDSRTGLLTNRRRERLSNGLLVTTKDEFLPEVMRWRTTQRWKEKGATRGYQFTVRAFVLPELKRLLEENGLRIQKLWGAYDDSPFAFDSPRLIILARKQ